ncbi:MAG TPA: hypothetical protein DHV15_03030 [Treponema sp.]|uniref:Uncharacterized protein n=1 Tax=Treponema denticola (strain ATCC 35405 / DSM 14222 / CIP 103919 / JCM 8153 / KCTC 15104) TaxID=243275 RepID=Q73PW2_TREDE|nr:hypothetical protein TDE_0683 [Treponema denticola ATCC 35405]HCY94472.1 hypothetical protein [Treponema sp.]
MFNKISKDWAGAAPLPSSNYRLVNAIFSKIFKKKFIKF